MFIQWLYSKQLYIYGIEIILLFVSLFEYYINGNILANLYTSLNCVNLIYIGI